MMPTHSKLTRKVRIAIMLSLFLTFFIISPLLILYTTGYRYDFDKKQILQTGVISIDVLPKHTKARLNGIAIDKRMPIRLNNRAPGTYHLTLSAEGYHTWEKDITVTSRQTTYIKDITLPKEAIPTLTTLFEDEEVIPDVIPTSNYPYALSYSDEEGLFEFRILDATDERYTPVIRKQAVAIQNITWSPFAPYVAITLKTEEDALPILYLIDAQTQAVSKAVSISKDMRLHWSAAEPTSLFLITQSGIITAVTPDTTARLSLSVTNGSAYILSNSEAAYVVTKYERPTLTFTDSNRSDMTLSEPVEYILYLSDHLLIGAYEETIQIFSLDATAATHQATLQGTHMIQNDTGVLFVWSPLQLWSVQPSGAVSLLYRTSIPIYQILPFNQHGELLLCTEEGLLLFNPGYYTTTKLLDHPVSAAFLDSAAESIYFRATIGTHTGMYQLAY